MVSRRPDAIIHPQFFAEGGQVFYADAWNNGLKVLFRARGGYLHTLERLAGAIAVHFPLAWGPSIFVLVAAIIQIAPIWYLLSRRLDSVIPSLPVRILLCLIYVALPNSYGESMNLINADWHLAIVSFILLYADAPKGRFGWIRDLTVIAIGGLTGPFAVLIWPLAVWRWWRDRSSWRLTILVSETVFGIIQGLTILLTLSSNKAIGAHLGATWNLLARIIAGQVIVGSLIGMNQYTHIYNSHIWIHTLIPDAITLAAGILLLWAFIKGPDVLKGLILFAVITMAASLRDPLLSTTTPQWLVMLMPGAGTYYYMFPMLAWIATLIWYVSRSVPAILPLDTTLPDTAQPSSPEEHRLSTGNNAVLPDSPNIIDSKSRITPNRHNAVLPDSSDATNRGKSNIGNGATVVDKPMLKLSRWRLVASIIGVVMLLSLFLLGIPGDWSYPPYLPLSWSAAAAKVEHVKPGTRVTIPINPQGWTMTLDAHGTKPALPHRKSRTSGTGSTGHSGGTGKTVMTSGTDKTTRSNR
ncbi:MAG: hypothetical protein M1280_02795 [Actinobacteria bacterium]|nr:hypothetical protein [Actinomycetota bacterium]